MKGIELPINVLVIVAIAVIVLLGVVILYFIGWSPFSTAVSVESIKNKYCAQLIRIGCPPDSTSWLPINDFDANQNGKIYVGTNGPFDWSKTGTVYDNEKLLCGSTATDPTISADNLASLCWCYFRTPTDVACGQLCGCP